MAIAAGRLRSRIAIERPNLVDNKRGGRSTPAGQAPWLSIAERVPAECIPLRGGEALANLVQQSKQLWKVTVRSRSGISTSMRLRWTDPALGEIIANIRSAVPNDTRDGLIITAESGVPT